MEKNVGVARDMKSGHGPPVESLGVYAVGARVQCAVGEQVRAEGGQCSGGGLGHAHQSISLLQCRGLCTPLHALHTYKQPGDTA